MIVEDDPMMLDIYKMKFSEAGFEIFLADNGKQALGVIEREKIEVVVSDLVMSEMDGFELIKTLRSGRYDANIKIIILSNLSDSEGKVLEMGANGFITKSTYVPSEMVNEVKRIIGEGDVPEK